MNISEIFIRRPIMTSLVMASLLFFGIFCFLRLPVSDLPNVDYPVITVSASYPGSDPETIANNIAVPLEQQFMTIEGITTISSTSSTGSTTIVLQFDLNKSLDIAAQDVQAAISEAIPLLPQNLPYNPTYSKVNPSASPILYLVLTSSTMTLGDLYAYGNNVIGKRLNMISGVGHVENYGSPFAVRVQVDPQKLAAKNIGIDELAKTIQQQNVDQPTGTLYGNQTEFTIDVKGQLFDAKDYEMMIIKNQNGSVVRLRDVGRALNSVSEDKNYYHYLTADSDLPSIVLAIQTQPGVNTLTVINRVKELLPNLEKELPGSLQLSVLFDRSEYIKEAVHEVEITLIVACILVIGVIFAYLGKVRDTIIPSVAIPLTILGTFCVMSLLGYTVDILSLLAITLSIGFLVDDAIVVLENIVRHVEKGETPFQAALLGSKQISFTILSMTLSLAAVFIPLLFMGDVVGRLFNEFSCTIVAAVLISGFISLSLTPMLCSRFVPAYADEQKKTRAAHFSEMLNTRMLAFYHKTLLWVIRHKKTTLLGGFLSLFLTLLLFKVLPLNFIPTDDIGFVIGYTQAQDGTSPFQMDKYQNELSQILQKDPGIDSIVSLGGIPTDSEGILFMRLKPLRERAPMPKMIDSLTHNLNVVPGVQTFVSPLPLINLSVGTTQARGLYQYTIESLNAQDLYQAAQPFIDKIKQLPGLSGVSSDLQVNQPQLKIEILRDKASSLGVSVQAIQSALGFAYAGANLSPINLAENQYYVILEFLPKFYKDPSALSQFYIRSSSSNNKLVPLSAVTRISEGLGPLTVRRLDGMPAVTITFNLKDIPLSTAIEQIEKIARETLPATVSGSTQGSTKSFQNTFFRLFVLLLVTVFVIYVILGILYENLFHPFTILSTLPPATLGGLLTLLIFDEPLSLYAFVGFVLLIGIVKKNGIILVDFAVEARHKEGKNAEEAILEACTARFRPIMMTTLAAIMGAVPIALGVGGLTAQGRRPLGMVIIGGLIFSQILTLYLTPVIYLYFEALQEKLHRKKGPKALDETPQKLD